MKSASVIALPIIEIINANLEQLCYPSLWEMGQATLLFKKPNDNNIVNYRPVTGPFLITRLERLLAAQLGDVHDEI